MVFTDQLGSRVEITMWNSTGSVWAAFVVHALANIASVPGGIVGVIIYRIVHGEVPAMQ